MVLSILSSLISVGKGLFNFFVLFWIKFAFLFFKWILKRDVIHQMCKVFSLPWYPLQCSVWQCKRVHKALLRPWELSQLSLGKSLPPPSPLIPSLPKSHFYLKGWLTNWLLRLAYVLRFQTYLKKYLRHSLYNEWGKPVFCGWHNWSLPAFQKEFWKAFISYYCLTNSRYLNFFRIRLVVILHDLNAV